MTLSAIEVDQLKQASATEEVLPAMRSRWSPRAFSSRSVSPADLRKVFEAARWAPSSGNEQPWRFIVGLQGSDTFNKILSSLAEANQLWASKAPVLILGVAKKDFSNNNRPNPYALFDLGSASGFLVLQAAANALSAHQIGGFSKDAARAALGIPETFELGSVIALGYQGEPSTLPNEQLLNREIAPRSRKSLDEIVLSGWGVPATLA